jgi:putative membrane protein
MMTESVETRSVRGTVALLTVVVCVAVALVMGLRPADSDGGRVPGAIASVNAALNAAAAVCLVVGYVFIRRRNVLAHRVAMVTAWVLSALFLVGYLAHHAQVGSVPYRGAGWMRALYFTILVPHVVLAAAVVPLALLTLYRGWTGRVGPHRRIARWTLPLWLYVSVSGVAIYLMLYHI